MFAICRLRKYGDGRPATKQTEKDNKKKYVNTVYRYLHLHMRLLLDLQLIEEINLE